MKQVRWRSSTAAVCAGIISSMVLAAPAAQAVAPGCDMGEDRSKPTLISYNPSVVTLGLDPVSPTFGVKAKDNCAIEGWSIGNSKLVFWVFDRSATEVFNTLMYDNKQAGKSYVEVSVNDENFNETTKVVPFWLKRRTVWSSTNAGPEPVRKGVYITMSGRLVRADWDQDRYGIYRDQTVSLQFKPKGATSFRHVKYGRTSATGWVSIAAPARQAGEWRLRFGGNDTSNMTASAADYVGLVG